MKLYTIGFVQKRAEAFFALLRLHGIQRILDIRVSPDGQLAGFTKKADFPYFLSHLADGCLYTHLPELAPTREMLGDYRADNSWSRYVTRFEALMDERRIPHALDRAAFETHMSCLLCSEPTARQCHRRLVAERLQAHWGDVEIVHL